MLTKKYYEYLEVSKQKDLKLDIDGLRKTYKESQNITVGNKTIFASNEDAWRLTPHIWFENRTSITNYGAAFTGSRYDGENGYAPQTGMNEMGLAFERLVSYHPKSENFADRKKITKKTFYTLAKL